jgi:hypothetical protein
MSLSVDVECAGFLLHPFELKILRGRQKDRALMSVADNNDGFWIEVL